MIFVYFINDTFILFYIKRFENARDLQDNLKYFGKDSNYYGKTSSSYQ